MFNNFNMDSMVFLFFLNLSIITGIIGSIVVLKRMSSIAGSVSHSLLGSVALANFLKVNPLIVSIPFVFVLSFIIHYIKKTKKVEEETALSMMWVAGVSLGIILISISKTYSSSVSYYLFGNVLFTDLYDVVVSSIFSLFLVTFFFIFNREIKNIILDEEYSQILGINTSLFGILILFITSLAIVLVIKAIGIILLIAIFTIPPTIAIKFSDSIEKCISITSLVGFVSFIMGYYLSMWLNLPVSSTITATLLTLFFASELLTKERLKKVR